MTYSFLRKFFGRQFWQWLSLRFSFWALYWEARNEPSCHILNRMEIGLRHETLASVVPLPMGRALRDTALRLQVLRLQACTRLPWFSVAIERHQPQAPTSFAEIVSDYFPVYVATLDYA